MKKDSVTVVSNLDDLMQYATVTCEVKEYEKLSEAEKSRRRTFDTAFKDLTFFFDQVTNRPKEGIDLKSMSKFKQRLADCLQLIEKGIASFAPWLIEQLKSDDPFALAGAVYVLSSVELKEESSLFLDQVLREFELCDNKRSGCFVRGLKEGKHPKIYSKIVLLAKEKKRDHLYSSCLDIMNFNSNYV